uniref:Uncharacterized protein n=1 Tax=Manihot esculenta TaxID=3983 RepID=A0A2C9VGF4_MANES
MLTIPRIVEGDMKHCFNWLYLENVEEDSVDWSTRKLWNWIQNKKKEKKMVERCLSLDIV